MRGALADACTLGSLKGIIPADAGSTFVEWLKWSFREDHPRGCGEHYAIHAAKNVERRIIPADAGSTPVARTERACSGDHPRGCGEHRSRVGSG